MIGRLRHIITESGYSGLVKRLSARVFREQDMIWLLTRDIFFGSYKKQDKKYALNSIIKRESLNLLHNSSAVPLEVIKHYLEHRFDLLGSGWVKIYYGMSCRGLEKHRFDMGEPIDFDRQGNWLKGRINHSNLFYSQKIWQKVDPNYIPIDWQLDFKSGYRWSEKAWSKKIKFGHKLGVDVKVPWELARMQHLPQLALYCLSNELNEADKAQIQKEFQNQILDFIATNPPGFGVNWVCPMDVAIRAANWLLARDIFLAASTKFPVDFEKILGTSIYDHGAQIVENLEWNPQRANHYLADIAGLVFIAAYLPSNSETDVWLAFATQELIVEVDRQFYKDGGNFEGSTAYHRLSAEMVYYATALILGLPKERLETLKSYDHTLFKKRRGKPVLQPAPLPFYTHSNDTSYSPFPQWYYERMERMAEFIMGITKPNGHIPQIGDNDSGRFFKLEPKYQVVSVRHARETYANLEGFFELHDDASYFVENSLDCSHLVSAGYGLFKRVDFGNWLGGQEIASSKFDTIMFNALAQYKTVTSQRSYEVALEEACSYDVGTEETFKKNILKIEGTQEFRVKKTEYTITEGNLLEGLRTVVFPDFGLYIFKSNRIYLLVRCWTGLQSDPSSHRHQDQLTLELSIDGSDLIRDPGTYLYTPIPAKRFLYRNSSSHFPPGTNLSKASGYIRNVFGAVGLEKVQLNYFGRSGCIAKSVEDQENKHLAISLGNKCVVIYHVLQYEGSNMGLFEKPSFSQGYGIRLI